MQQAQVGGGGDGGGGGGWFEGRERKRFGFPIPSSAP